jgi:hypothetical protein
MPEWPNVESPKSTHNFITKDHGLFPSLTFVWDVCGSVRLDRAKRQATIAGAVTRLVNLLNLAFVVDLSQLLNYHQ